MLTPRTHIARRLFLNALGVVVSTYHLTIMFSSASDYIITVHIDKPMTIKEVIPSPPLPPTIQQHTKLPYIQPNILINHSLINVFMDRYKHFKTNCTPCSFQSYHCVFFFYIYIFNVSELHNHIYLYGLYPLQFSFYKLYSSGGVLDKCNHEHDKQVVTIQTQIMTHLS